MLKFIRGKGHQPSAERQKQQRELFAFRNTIHHGFPNKPTALAWDPFLRVMAIGTSSGAIKVVGKPGVEFYGQHHSNENPVTKILFIPNRGRLITLCDNALNMWEINEGNLEIVKTHTMEGKLKISALCLQSSGKNLLLGTEGGNINVLNVDTFAMVELKVGNDHKANLGALEAIAEQPGEPEKILFGFSRGTMVLWNMATSHAEETYNSTQDLESLCWHDSGSKFASSHNDGSYAVFNVPKGNDPQKDSQSPHGPFPCKAISKLLWRKTNGDDLIIFSGGLPRASHSDRFSITLIQGEKLVVLDFTSKVVDFFTISPKAGEEGADAGPEALVVLVEEELVVIDLHSKEWLPIVMPYLVSVHASSVTCSQYVTDVSEELWDKIETIGRKQFDGHYSRKDWPIDGGKDLSCNSYPRDLLLTGHEDGSVRFWSAGGVALRPLCRLTTANFFQSDDVALDDHGDSDDSSGWTFKKVGCFDPYSDDPRLAIKKLSLCPVTGTLVVAGTAGHIIVAELNEESKEEEIPVTVMNIVSDRDGFVWKGHSHLTAHESKVKIPAGFQPLAIIQLAPPVVVTALMLHSDWGLIAAGTAHGLALFDYIRRKPVITKCTLNPNDLSGAGEQAISRRKSFKKSLRESFRRLRKGRSTRHGEKRGGATSIVASPSAPDRKKEGAIDTAALEPKPVERQVEARSVDNSQGSMVRCVYLARTYIVSVQNTTPTLWAGTNNGTVYVFTLSVPQKSKRKDEDVSCQLGKEIQLKHRAPVIGIAIVDSAGVPLPDPLETSPNPVGLHRVIISSEEQFKMFTLPNLKPICKLKLTAHEGSRVRRTAMALFKSVSTASPPHSEWCLMCLTNLGDCIVLSTPDLRRQLNAAVIRREDVHGISSLCFSKRGEALYLHSSSEFQRVTLSAHYITQAHGQLDLPTGTRSVVASETNEAVPGNVSEVIQEESEEEEIEVIVTGEPDVKLGNSTDMKVRTPSPAPRASTTPTLVNGDSDPLEKKDASSSSIDEPKENGMPSEEERLEISMGDITIDSVKDHLMAATSLENL